MSIFLDPSVEKVLHIEDIRTVQLSSTHDNFTPRNSCSPTSGGDCAQLPHLSTNQNTGVATTAGGCILVTPSGQLTCPDVPDSSACSPIQLQKQTADNCYINSLANENLNIGGADACVFKMLGVHQQGTLIDAAGTGRAIASDSLPDFPAANAFDRFARIWQSDSCGAGLLKSWIGYDFGSVKRDSGLLQYSLEASAEVRKHITSIAIKQDGDSSNWVKKVRVERSDDGVVWRGVDIISLPQTNERTLLSVKSSVPARMWRLTPTDVTGTNRWKVDTLELFEFIQTDLRNIQDSPLFQENRDRSYCTNPIRMKIHYDLVDVNTELSRFGIDLPSAVFTFSSNFSETVKQLGRGFVIGDVLEIPSEIQFTSDMKIVRKYVEITDVKWDTAGYTPGWVPLFQKIVARPMLARQETLDLVGSLENNLNPENGGTGFGPGSDPLFSTFALEANERIQIAADTMTPQLGQDQKIVADVSEFPKEHVDSANAHGIGIAKLTTDFTDRSAHGLYKDAMPPKGTPPELFTIGDTSKGFPQFAVNGAYHRVTYESVEAEQIPPKLYRYSAKKNRWVYMESDERYAHQSNKTRLKTYLVDEQRMSLQDIK